MFRFFKKIIVWILTKEAIILLRRMKPKIVAVTGSVGKTATKDAIFSVVGQGFHVRKSQKSFNSEIGIPLTVLGLNNAWSNPIFWTINIFRGLFVAFFARMYPDVLVLEVGADSPGDIERITAWLKPDVAVMTQFANIPAHVEFFNSPEAVFEEKAHLARAVPADGYVVLNGDDENMSLLRESVKASVVTVGFGANNDVRGESVTVAYRRTKLAPPSGIKVKVSIDKKSKTITVGGVLGKGYARSALVAIAVGSILGIEPLEQFEGLAQFDPPTGRMRLIPGLKNTTIIDDTYNASPLATTHALEALREIRTTGRKIAILGDMLELGKYASEAHKNVGECAGKVVDDLITVGFRARGIAEGALISGLSEEHIHQFEDANAGGKKAEFLIQEGDIVLIKGSQSMRMERAVEEIMAEPAKASELLVRQEDAWKKR